MGSARSHTTPSSPPDASLADSTRSASRPVTTTRALVSKDTGGRQTDAPVDPVTTQTWSRRPRSMAE